MTKTLVPNAVAAALLWLGAGAASACATCGCSLSTDAATGYAARPGWSVGLQYDDIDQSQLRHGSKPV